MVNYHCGRTATLEVVARATTAATLTTVAVQANRQWLLAFRVRCSCLLALQKNCSSRSIPSSGYSSSNYSKRSRLMLLLSHHQKSFRRQQQSWTNAGATRITTPEADKETIKSKVTTIEIEATEKLAKLILCAWTTITVATTGRI